MSIDLNKIFQSKTVKTIFWAIGALIILLFVFQTGVFVGFKKTAFSCRWGENYLNNFIGQHKGFGKKFEKEFFGKDLFNAHGVFGVIIKLDDSTFVIKGTDGMEKIVVLTDKTVINRFHETIKATDLKVDDNIVVIGSPNEAGQIEAKLIRVMPLPLNK